MSPIVPEMTCQEFVELVTEYLDGALPHQERERFEQHLGGCPYCAFYLEQIRKTIALVGALGEHDLDAEARATLLGAFRRWRDTER